MATSNYPSGLDDYSALPSSGQPISVGSHYFGPAITNIEAELGTDPAGSHSTVKDRMDQVDSAMGFKNRIIGGNFSTNPWQRGTSFTSHASGYTADRFTLFDNTSGVIDGDKTADAPTVAEAGVFTQHCLDVDVTTSTGSIGSSEIAVIYQPIEGYNILDLGFGQSGTRYFTLSFWHKHTKTGTHCVSIRNASTNRSYVSEYTQSISDTWEKAEITIPVDTSGTWNYTNGIGLYCSFTIAVGSARQTTAESWQSGDYVATSNQVNNLDSDSNHFKIALVQLEAGDKATRFETRSIGQELELCQRYYYRHNATGNLTGASGSLYNASNGRVWARFPVTMRSGPSLNIEDLTYEIIGLGSTTVASSGGGASTIYGASWDGLGASPTGYNGQPFAYSGRWSAEAEL